MKSKKIKKRLWAPERYNKECLRFQPNEGKIDRCFGVKHCVSIPPVLSIEAYEWMQTEIK